MKWAEAHNSYVLSLYAMAQRTVSLASLFNSYVVHAFPDPDPATLHASSLPIAKQHMTRHSLTGYLACVLGTLNSALRTAPAVTLYPLLGSALLLIRRLRYLTPSTRLSRGDLHSLTRGLVHACTVSATFPQTSGALVEVGEAGAGAGGVRALAYACLLETGAYAWGIQPGGEGASWVLGRGGRTPPRCGGPSPGC